MKLGENLGLDRFYLDKGIRKTVLPAREALDEGPSRAGPQVRNHGVIFAPGHSPGPIPGFEKGENKKLRKYLDRQHFSRCPRIGLRRLSSVFEVGTVVSSRNVRVSYY